MHSLQIISVLAQICQTLTEDACVEAYTKLQRLIAIKKAFFSRHDSIRITDFTLLNFKTE